MDEIFLSLANKVSPKEVIYFLIIIGLFAMIAILLHGLRAKDKLLALMLNDFIKEISENGNQITQLTAIVNYLAFNQRHEHDEDKSGNKG